LADARDGKDFFDDKAAGENTGGERAGISDERKDGGPEGMKKDERFFGDSFGAGGADEIGPDRFKKAGAGESRTDADEGESEAEGGENELEGGAPASWRPKEKKRTATGAKTKVGMERVRRARPLSQ
jgi:hypothetical protein